jgi:signal transduction histidine kinase
VLAIYSIHTTKDKPVDISAVNNVVKNIQYQIETGVEPVYDESEYRVIMFSDNHYESTMYKAIQQDAITADLIVNKTIVGKVIFPSQHTNMALIKNKLSIVVSVVFLIMTILFYNMMFLINFKILKPFEAMKTFAGKVATGDFDFPLGMDKENYFGAFTESFDLMREELKKAKEGEYNASLSKKELVASLSHDIKTPVATIKAYCEILNIKFQDNPDVDKINIIYNKADVIDQLISNMFHATLEELQMLKIKPAEELSSIIPLIFKDMNHYDKIMIKNEIPDCLIYCDKLRLEQVIDNIINNSYKYADTAIHITYSLNEKFLNIEIRDFGNGVSENEPPLVFEKFYRGKNTENINGSGLGLYLAKQFMEGMNGIIEAYNDSGFVIVLHISVV